MEWQKSFPQSKPFTHSMFWYLQTTQDDLTDGLFLLLLMFYFLLFSPKVALFQIFLHLFKPLNLGRSSETKFKGKGASENQNLGSNKSKTSFQLGEKRKQRWTEPSSSSFMNWLLVSSSFSSKNSQERLWEKNALNWNFICLLVHFQGIQVARLLSVVRRCYSIATDITFCQYHIEIIGLCWFTVSSFFYCTTNPS